MNEQTETWVQEEVQQLRLALAWGHYAARLEALEPGSPLVTEIRRKVFDRARDSARPADISKWLNGEAKSLVDSGYDVSGRCEKYALRRREEGPSTPRHGREYVENWIGQAVALAAWYEIQKNLTPQEEAPPSPPPRKSQPPRSLRENRGPASSLGLWRRLVNRLTGRSASAATVSPPDWRQIVKPQLDKISETWIPKTLVELGQKVKQAAGPSASAFCLALDRRLQKQPSAPKDEEHRRQPDLLEAQARRDLVEIVFRTIEELVKDEARLKVARKHWATWTQQMGVTVRQKPKEAGSPKPGATDPHAAADMSSPKPAGTDVRATANKSSPLPGLRDLRRQLVEGTIFHRRCKELEQAFSGQTSLETWWRAILQENQKDPGRLEQKLSLLWCWMAQATASATDPKSRDLVTELMGELAKQGFDWADTPLGDAALESADAPWLLLAASQVDRPAALFHTKPGGVSALLVPDGRVFFPTLWLRMPEAWTCNVPVLDCLVQQAPLVARLRALDSDWSGWKCYNDDIWRIVLTLQAADGQRQLPTDERLLALFKDLYARAQPTTSAFTKELEGLVRLMYESLTPDQLDALPVPLFADTLQPDVPQLLSYLSEADVADPELVWAVPGLSGRDPQPNVRPYRSVLAFRMPADQRAYLELSLGPDFPPELASWLNLPSPQGVGSSRGTEPSVNPLTGLYRELRRGLGEEPQPLAARVKHCDDEAFRLLNDPAASDWFNAFIQDALAGPGDGSADSSNAARAWLRVFSRRPWWRCYPGIDVEDWRVVWPKSGTEVNESPSPGRLTWQFDPETDAGGLISTSPLRFAPTAPDAEAAFSRGKCIPGSGYQRAYWLSDVALPNEVPPSFKESARRLLSAVDHQQQLAVPCDQPAVLILPMLRDLLATWQTIPAAEPQAAQMLPLLDDLLNALRTVARDVFQLTIFPEPWQFANPPSPVDLGAGVPTSEPEFSSRIPVGTVGVSAFSVGQVQDCRTFVSAGPAPVHYEKLLNALADLSDHHPHDSLKTWPAKGAKAIDCVACEFYELFYEQLAGESVGPRAEMIGYLEKMMEERFHLVPFEVHEYRDVDSDWLEAEGKPRSGQVQVLRPGLVEAGNRKVMRVRAKVKVE